MSYFTFNRFGLVAVVVLLLVGGAWLWLREAQAAPIRIGVLHALSGPMAPYERPIVDALQMAIEEINRGGGLLGRPVEALVTDCRSDAAVCAQEAERLIDREHVSALFGCWQSACRKAVRQVVEQRRHLLFYPLQYEGMEQSPNIVYLGAAPNQQLIPAVRWALDNLGKRFYLVGSDSVFPRVAHLMMREIIQAQGGEVLGERYLPPEAAAALPAIADVIVDLRRLKPEVVINTINGDANQAFFVSLAGAGYAAQQLPVISTSIAENGVQAIPGAAMTGHYAVWNYFQSLPGETNTAFVAGFRKRFGAERVVNDPVEASYVGLRLWAQAVREAGTDHPAQINITILKQSMSAPEGIVSLDKATRHLWRNVRIGQVRGDGQFDVIWSSTTPVGPEPYPAYRPRAEWDRRLVDAGLRP